MSIHVYSPKLQLMGAYAFGKGGMQRHLLGPDDELQAAARRRLPDPYGSTSRRSAAQRVSSWRLESCSLRSTADTCASTVFGEMPSRWAISLYM